MIESTAITRPLVIPEPAGPWVLLKEEAAVPSDLNPSYLWLKLDKRVLGVAQDLLPKNCCLSHMLEDLPPDEPVIVDAGTFFPSAKPDILMAILLDKPLPTPSPADDILERVRLLDFLGMDDKIKELDNRLADVVHEGDARLWWKTVLLSRSVDPSSLSYTRSILQSKALRLVFSVLGHPLPEWTKKIPLEEVERMVNWEVASKHVWPVTRQSIDLLFSHCKDENHLYLDMPDSIEVVEYLMRKVEEHRHIVAIGFPGGVRLTYVNRRKWRASLDVDYQNIFEKSLEVLKFLPASVPLKVVDLARDTVEQLTRLCEKTRLPLIIPENFWNLCPFHKLAPSDILALLPHIKSLQLKFDQNRSSQLVAWKEAIAACASPEKISLTLDLDAEEKVVNDLWTFLDLPVKKVNLILGWGMERLQRLTLEQGAKVTGLDITRLPLSRTCINMIPFSMFPNLKEVAAMVGSNALAALKQQLAAYRELKKCYLLLKLDTPFTGVDSENVPHNVAHLEVDLSYRRFDVTPQGLIDFIQGYPSKISIHHYPGQFSSQDRQRVRAAWVNHNAKIKQEKQESKL